jgi:hypothetical protein
MRSNPFRIEENEFDILRDTTRKPPYVPTQDVINGLDKDGIDLLKKIGITQGSLTQTIQDSIQVNYDRLSLYGQLQRALDHWMVGASMELYADYATSWSAMHEASVWVTANSDKYENELNDMLDRIGIEERIYDWAFNVGAYGDLFVRPEAGPGMGVVAVNDNEHPMSVSRADYKGQLIGFYWTPNTPNCGGIQSQGQYTGDAFKLMPPWDWVHFRLLGAKKKRFGTYENQREIRSMNIVTGENTYQLTTRYGTSLLINALPTYKRLRLAEDSLLMARITRGIIRYIWKLSVDQSSAEAVAALVDQYATMITRARAIDTDPDNPYYDSRQNPFGSMEDIFVPVWGDVGNLSYEKVGGEADIRWIVDVEQLRNQLAVSLRTPLSLLGGFVKEATGSLGSEAIEELDIRFARNARRLQRAIVEGVYRLCQINLAYMNMDPDPTLYNVHMGETSTAEEEAVRESLDKGVDTIGKFIDVAEQAVGEGSLDKQKMFDYFSRKILRLEDFHIEDFVKEQDAPVMEGKVAKRALAVEEAIQARLLGRRISRNTDLCSFVPVQWEDNGKGSQVIAPWYKDSCFAAGRIQENWQMTYGEAMVREVEAGDDAEEEAIQ